MPDPNKPSPEDFHLVPTVVAHMMTPGVVQVPGDVSVSEAALLLEREHAPCLLVKETDTVFGLMTPTDIVKKVVAQGLEPHEIEVRAIMTRPVQFIEYDEALEEASTMMLATGRHGVIALYAGALDTRVRRVALRQTAQESVVTVRLNLYAPQAKNVAVSGDFNKWRVDSDVMSRQDGGVWTIDIKLKPGVYTYMFVVDGKAWVTDPDAETYQDDGFGNKNAVMRVRT